MEIMDRDDSPAGRGTPYELDDIAELPGTYFNPRTEVTVIVDDSGSVDQGILPEAAEGADWIRVSEEPAIDEQLRDELLEQFEAGARTGSSGSDLEMLDPDDAFDEDDEPEDLGSTLDPTE